MSGIHNPQLRSRALAAYRTLLRSCQSTFKGDSETLVAAHAEIRRRFKESAENDTSEEVVLGKIEEAEQVAVFLRQNVLQGKHLEGETYEVKIQPETELTDMPKKKC
eukprot:Clim_evm25s152 gene=Clim_evmTU25s152